MYFKTDKGFLAAAVLYLLAWASPGLAAAEFASQKVAVVVFSANKQLETSVVPTVRARIEEILSDNSVGVLDKEQSERLAGGWAALEDPGYLLTAEQLVEASERFGIDGVLRVYVNADVQEVFGDYYSATAQVDLRYVKEDASTTAKTNHPMGAPGSPPSDGLTQGAALVNALQRAVDQSLESLGLVMSAPQSPRTVKISVDGPLPQPAPATGGQAGPRLDAEEVGIASLANKRWESEQATCSSKAPGGDLGVVGGLTRAVVRGDSFVHLGTKLHVLDLAGRKELQQYEIEPVSRRSRESSGTVSIHDCVFLGAWRYVALLTSNHLILRDIERGLEVGRADLPEGIDRGSLQIYRESGRSFIVVEAQGKWIYGIQADRRK